MGLKLWFIKNVVKAAAKRSDYLLRRWDQSAPFATIVAPFLTLLPLKMLAVAGLGAFTISRYTLVNLSTVVWRAVTWILTYPWKRGAAEAPGPSTVFPVPASLNYELQISRRKVRQTPDSHFASLPGYTFRPHYLTIHGVKVHYIDEEPLSGTAKHGRDGSTQVVVCLHSSLTWSYLYRKLVPHLVQSGYRVLALDLIGFGKSDKLKESSSYTAELHVSTLNLFLRKLHLKHVTLMAQGDGATWALWGLADMQQDVVDKVVLLSPPPLPPLVWPHEIPLGAALSMWVWGLSTHLFLNFIPVSYWVSLLGACTSPQEAKGYNAPFPSLKYKAALATSPSHPPPLPLISAPKLQHCSRTPFGHFLLHLLPGLAATLEELKGVSLRGANTLAVLKFWRRPVMVVYGSDDPLLGGGLMKPGVKAAREYWKNVFHPDATADNQGALVIPLAGHYLPENPDSLLDDLLGFMQLPISGSSSPGKALHGQSSANAGRLGDLVERHPKHPKLES